MKYLLWLLIIGAGIWWIRKQRQTPSSDSHKPAAPAQPTHMWPCAHCGVLCPETDTVAGKQGRYCSDAHRQSHEG